jgi:choline dehydrogenase-like flavoprotein
MAYEKVDVLIIGSGHTGGMAAKVLTEKGISCLMLNAGPIVDYKKDVELKAAYELPYRGLKKPGQLKHVSLASGFDANAWVDEKENPYSFDASKPYNWVRVRVMGGRSLFWGRQSFRLSDYEFQSKDHDGFGENWPIRLKDLAPYYSRVEEIFQVVGHQDGLPQYPDGNFIADDAPWSGSMQRFVDAGKKHGVPVCKPRSARGRNGLASSINLLLPDAMATGKLNTVQNAVVRELTVDKNTGLVDGANFVDRHSMREMHVKARIVIVAAGCLESTRLLMNSGIANSSGVLGHYLQDQIYGCGIACSVPEARDGKATKGLMGGGALIPRFRNLDTKAKNFIGGYSFNVSSNPGAIDAEYFATYGTELKAKLDSYYGSGFSMTTMASVQGHYENKVSINKSVVDSWGVPTLHIDTKYGENEKNMIQDAVDTVSAVAEDAGFEILVKNYEPNPPGWSIHEQGTCRMGDDPKKSVLNKWNQSHDIKNLFVVDASCFVSGGWQNPTMTMLALAMRSAEYMSDEMKRGNI